jgi:hypothetical protein
MRLLRKLKRLGREFHILFGMLVPGEMIVLIVMRPGGQVRMRGEIVKFRSALVPVVAARSAARAASAAFIAQLFAHKLSPSWMSEKCITTICGRVCCESPALALHGAGFSLRG